MVKLFRNEIEELDAIVLREGEQFSERHAYLISIADLTKRTLRKMDEPDKLLWNHFLSEEYRQIQRKALKPAQRLSPADARDILSDPKEEAYAVTCIATRDPYRNVPFNFIATARPDVVYFSNDKHEPYVKLWYLPVIAPSFEGACLTLSGKPTLVDFLYDAAVEKMTMVTGSKPLVVFDDQCNPSTLKQLVKSHNIGILAEVDVPSLKEGANSNIAVGKAKLLVESSGKYAEGLPLALAAEALKDYLTNRFGVHPTSRLLRGNVERLSAQAVNGVVRYSPLLLPAAQK